MGAVSFGTLLDSHETVSACVQLWAGWREEVPARQGGTHSFCGAGGGCEVVRVS